MPAKAITGQQKRTGYEYNMPVCWITDRHKFERCNDFFLFYIKVL